VINDVEIQQDQSSIKPNLDRAKEVLESFQLAQLQMVGTIQKSEKDTLWALISDDEGGVHMAKVGQFMGKNYGRIVAITDGRLDMIEIVPNGYGGWLERPRIIALEDEQ
jgi:type IV pilus assembly protein PilP